MDKIICYLILFLLMVGCCTIFATSDTKHRCKTFIGMGDGVGQCVECGKAKIFDKRKIDAPLYAARHKVEMTLDGIKKVCYSTDHQYYTEFLLIPCWLANVKCDRPECQTVKFHITKGAK